MSYKIERANDDIASHFGFEGDGTTNNTPILEAYISDTGSADRVLVFTEGTYLFDGGDVLYVPENIKMECHSGVTIQVDNSTKVIVRSVFDALPMRIFDLNSGGQFLVYGNTRVKPEWWGAIADGVTDCSEAIRNAMLAGPPREGAWSNGAYLKSSAQFVLEFGSGRHNTPVTEAGYSVDTVVEIPDFRSIHFDGGGRHGARLVNNTGGDWIFQVNPDYNSFQWRSMTFDGLVFDRGGLRLATNAATINHSSQGGVVIKDCTFYGTPYYAVEVGTRYVWGWIEKCTFDGCAGGVHFAERDSDLWTISESTFLRESTYPSITIRSSGITIYHCDFEVRNGSGLEQPFILVSDPATDLRVLHNRFGSEPTHPVSAIDFGEEGDDTATGPLLGIQIKGNQFKGFVTPTTNVAESCFRFYKPIDRCQIIGNQIWSYTQVAEELYANLPTSYARYSYDNLWKDNQLHFRNSTQIDKRLVFSSGGVGWFTDIEPVTNHVSSMVNYIAAPDIDSPSWQSTAAASPAPSGPGPDGSIQAYNLTRISGGSCYVNTLPTPVPEGEKLVYSIWAKAGTLDVLRLYAINGNNQAVSSFSEIFKLSDEWRQYHISLELPKAGELYRFYIYNGADGTGDTSGTIEVCDPRVNIGDAPYLPTWARPLDYIDLSDYRTASGDVVDNHTYGWQIAMDHAAAAGRKLRITSGRTWYGDDVQPADGIWIDARGATINGVSALAINDQVGVDYNIQGGTWNDGTVPTILSDGRLQADNLAQWAPTVADHTGAGTLVSGQINRVDPTGGPYTLDLPASPEVGDTVGIKNVTTDATVITIDGNGNNIEGSATFAFSGSRAKLVLTWDGTDWIDL